MPTKPPTKQRPWLPAAKQRTPQARVNPNISFYNSRAWRKVSTAYLATHPFCMCEQCRRLPVPLPSHVTDHITPINQGGDPWDERNYQAMNSRCHNRKSGKEAHK